MKKTAERKAEINSDLERNVLDLNPIIDGVSPLISRGCQIVGPLYTLFGECEHHVRDGIIIFAAGSLIYYASMAVGYLNDIRDNLKEK